MKTFEEYVKEYQTLTQLYTLGLIDRSERRERILRLNIKARRNKISPLLPLNVLIKCEYV